MGTWRRLTPDTRAGTWLFLLLFGFFALWAGGHTYSSDEEGAYLQAQALMRGTYVLDVTPENRPITALRAGRDGQIAAVGGIGASAAAVPLLAVGKVAATTASNDDAPVIERLFTGFTNSWITAMIAVVIFLTARELGARRRPAVLLALVYGVGTMAWPHAKTLIFSEPLAALLVTVGILWGIRAVRRGSWHWALLAGLALGASTLARISTAPFVIIVGAYIVLTLVAPLVRDRLRARSTLILAGRQGALYVAGAAIPALALIGVNSWRYGDASDTGYGAVQFDFSPLEGIYGLLLSPGKGLVFYAPVVVVALVAIPFAFRRKPAEVLMLLAIVVANLAIFGRFFQWHGEQAWGPRYMQVVLPAFVLIIAPVLADPLGAAWRRGLVAVGIVGAAVSMLGSTIYFNAYFAYAGERLGTEQVDGEPALWRPMHFDPEWSAIVGHARLLPDAISSSAARLDGVDESFGRTGVFPTTDIGRYLWYAWPPQIDTWWYWMFPQRTPKWPLILVPAFLAAMAFGVRGLRREVRQ